MHDDQHSRSLGTSSRTILPYGPPLYSDYDLEGPHRPLIPKTKGRRLDEMDIIFGVVQEDKRRVDIAQQQCSA